MLAHGSLPISSAVIYLGLVKDRQCVPGRVLSDAAAPLR
jgi:hypothetical protein